MSYRHLTDEYVVTFENEENFLEARLEFLNGYYDGVLFADFLQSARDEGKYEITSVVSHVPYSFSFTGDSNTIYTEDAISNLDTFTPQVITMNHGHGDPSISISSAAPDNDFNSFLAAQVGPSLGTAWVDKEIEEIKEEPPNDPIDNRFDILDL